MICETRVETALNDTATRTFRAAIALPGALCLAQGALAANDADLIVLNARVVTLDAKSTVAEALAVQDGKPLAVGSSRDMQRLAGPGTRQIDAGGRTIIPGLIDSHMHAVRAALSYATEVNWIGAGTVDEAMDRLREAAAQVRPEGGVGRLRLGSAGGIDSRCQGLWPHIEAPGFFCL